MALSFMQMVANARQKVTEIDSDSLQDDLNQITLIDVRELSEYEAGHIKNAINIPRGVLESEMDSNPDFADKTQAIVLMCKTGGRSALSLLSVQQLGFTKLYSLKGGYLAWEAEGLPTVK